MMNFSHITKAVLVAGAIASLAACNGNDNGSGNNNPSVDTNTGLAPIVLSNVNPNAKESAGDYVNATTKAKVLITQFSSESNSVTFNMPIYSTGDNTNLIDLKHIYPIITPKQAIESIFINNKLVSLDPESIESFDLSTGPNKLTLIYSPSESKTFDIKFDQTTQDSRILPSNVILREAVESNSAIATTQTIIGQATGIITSKMNQISATTSLFPRFIFNFLEESHYPTISIAPGQPIKFESIPGFENTAIANYTITSKDGKTTVLYPHILKNAEPTDAAQAIGCSMESAPVISCLIVGQNIYVNTSEPTDTVKGKFSLNYIGKSVKYDQDTESMANPYVNNAMVVNTVAKDLVIKPNSGNTDVTYTIAIRHPAK